MSMHGSRELSMSVKRSQSYRQKKNATSAKSAVGRVIQKKTHTKGTLRRREFPNSIELYKLAERLASSASRTESPNARTWYMILCAFVSGSISEFPQLAAEHKQLICSSLQVTRTPFQTHISRPAAHAFTYAHAKFVVVKPSNSVAFFGPWATLSAEQSFIRDDRYLFYELASDARARGVAKLLGGVLGEPGFLGVRPVALAESWLAKVSSWWRDTECAVTPILLWALQYGATTSELVCHYLSCLLEEWFIPNDKWYLSSRSKSWLAWKEFMEMLIYLVRNDEYERIDGADVWRMFCYFLFEPIDSRDGRFECATTISTWITEDEATACYLSKRDKLLCIDRTGIRKAYAKQFFDMLFNAISVSIPLRARVLLSVTRSECVPAHHPATTKSARKMIYRLHFTRDDLSNWMRGCACICKPQVKPSKDDMHTARDRVEVAEKLAQGSACQANCQKAFYAKIQRDTGFQVTRLRPIPVPDVQPSLCQVVLPTASCAQKPVTSLCHATSCHPDDVSTSISIPVLFARVLEEKELVMRGISGPVSTVHPSQTLDVITFPRTVPDILLWPGVHAGALLPALPDDHQFDPRELHEPAAVANSVVPDP